MGGRPYTDAVVGTMTERAGLLRSLLAEARPRMGQGLRIDTVGIGLDQDTDLLQTLASESGGMAVMR